MVCMQLGIKLFYLLIYKRVDFLFVILFTEVRAMELSVDPSLTFFNFFFGHFFVFFVIFCWMHSVFYLYIDTFCLE